MLLGDDEAMAKGGSASIKIWSCVCHHPLFLGTSILFLGIDQIVK
jgi:hypothetical protein